jgi:hypothetical protein
MKTHNEWVKLEKIEKINILRVRLGVHFKKNNLRF